jgi:hypothetical protein
MIYNPDDPDLTLVDRGESKDRGGSTELCGIGIRVVMRGFTGELMSNSVQI